MDIVAPQVVAPSLPSGGIASLKVPQLGRDQFLKLLVTQLQNQDPTNPVKNEAFVAQLAQFTTLEQANNTNKLLTDLIDQGKGTSQLDLVGLIGHKVVAEGNSVFLGETGQTNLTYILGDTATSVTVKVLDGEGNVVRTLDNLGLQAVGRQEVAFDGNDDNGDRVPSGSYQFQVQAEDAKQNPISTTTFLSDIVKSVVMGMEQPMLVLAGGKTLTPADILAFE